MRGVWRWTGCIWAVALAVVEGSYAQALADEKVAFPTAGVRLPRPEGFEKAEDFEGFGVPESTTSVMALKLPGPFEKITSGFNAEQMKARGWTFRSSEEHKVGEYPAILVHFVQPEGGEDYGKWVVAFGDSKSTTMIMATFPKLREAEYSDRLKECLLAVEPIEGPPPPSRINSSIRSEALEQI
jgi:hypothetical protein